MDFSTFLEKISQPFFLEQTKSALEHHLEMVPKKRLNFDFSTIKNPKKAGVLALFYPNKKNETCFLLTLRANYKGVHSSQVSLPGGKPEPNDINLQNTALRESEEEVGIDKNKITIIKPLGKVFIPPSNIWVSPFIGILKTTPKFIKNYEVKELIEVRLTELLNDNSVKIKTLNTPYKNNIDVPCFILNNHIVWGATAMVLNEIKYLFYKNNKKIY